MLVTVVGFEKRRKGVSAKTGNPYDFTPIYYTYKHNRVEGVKVASRNVDASVLDPANIAVGVVLDMQFDGDGSLEGIYLPD